MHCRGDVFRFSIHFTVFLLLGLCAAFSWAHTPNFVMMTSIDDDCNNDKPVEHSETSHSLFRSFHGFRQAARVKGFRER